MDSTGQGQSTDCTGQGHSDDPTQGQGGEPHQEVDSRNIKSDSSGIHASECSDDKSDAARNVKSDRDHSENANISEDVSEEESQVSKELDSVMQSESTDTEEKIQMNLEDSNDSAYEESDHRTLPSSLYREGAMLPSNLLEEEEEEDEGIEDDEDDDDDEGWITPSNISEVKERMGETGGERASVTVGCVTTDFAMQVLK